MSYDVYRTMWGDQTEFKVTGTMSTFNFLPYLSEIKVPTLVIVGAKNMTTIEMAQETARQIPGARLVVFERSRHYPFIEEKEKFVSVMEEFLRES
jgi:proline iminopeptidase